MMRPHYDLPGFVDTLIHDTKGHVTVDNAVLEIDHEIATVERSLSRDSHERFQQMRYVKSLGRLVQFLRSHQLPADMTPRERLAIKNLGDFLGSAPEKLAEQFNNVTPLKRTLALAS